MKSTRMPEDLTYYGTTVQGMRTTSPWEVMQVAQALLSTIPLPAPFTGKARFSRWSPRQFEGEIPLPTVMWKIVETTTPPQRPDPVLITHETIAPGTVVELYQQDFWHTAHFECYAATPEEADVLVDWLYYQLMWNRTYIADTGAYHIRFLEAREDTVINIASIKYPVRPLRIRFSTASIFRVPQSILGSVVIDTHPTPSMHLGVIEVVRGEDVMPLGTAALISVRDLSEQTEYEPSFDEATRTIVWDDVEGPDLGDSYRVMYLYYGAERVRFITSAPPEP